MGLQVLIIVGGVALGGCTFERHELPIASGSDGAWLADYRYRKSIVITPPAATTLDAFPVGIVEPSDRDLAAHARTDGGDLVFTAEDAITLLAAELAGFDATTGALEAWVNIPSLRAPTTVWLYYGGPATPADATAVWSPLFAGVWHLGAGMAGHDSTAQRHDLDAPASTAMPAVVGGIAGVARAYDGVDDSLSTADPSDGSLDFGVESFSYSLWVRVTSNLGQYDTPIYKGCASVGDPGYCMLLGSGDWGGKLHDGTTFVDAGFGAGQLDVWTQLAVVIDRISSNQALAYRNGAFVSKVSLQTINSLSSSKRFEIGEEGSAPFHGVIDETRVYRQALGADWIATEYANLTSPNFVTFQPEQTRQ